MEKGHYCYRIERSTYALYPRDLLKLCETFNQMAEMIQSQMQSVQKSEKHYRMLVESSPNGIIVHQEGKIVYANPEFRRFLKASPESEFIGRHILQLQNVN